MITIQSAPPGPASLFGMAAFGAPDQQFQQSLQQRNVQQQQYLLKTYGVDTSSFFQQSQQFFNQYQNLTGMHQAATMIAQGVVETKAIKEPAPVFTPILRLGDFQTASRLQQDYLLCNPFLKKMFIAGEISGFGRDVNQVGTAIGMDDPVYRQAIDGLSQSSLGPLPDDVDEIYIQNLDDPIPDLPVMDAVQQSHWVQACKLSEVLVHEGIDVTHKDLKFIGE